MIEIALSTATQRRPFLPLTVSQRRRRSLDDARQRLTIAAATPNLIPMPAAHAPRPINPSNCIASVVPTSRKQTIARLKSP
jgi:hypothetical protein